MTKERLFILIRRSFFEYFSQNFLFKAQDNFQFMIIPFRITPDFFINKMIGSDFKECKDWNEFIYLTHFLNYAFSTYGIIKSNSSIFIKNNDSEKRLQLFLKPGFIVNILIV